MSFDKKRAPSPAPPPAEPAPLRLTVRVLEGERGNPSWEELGSTKVEIRGEEGESAPSGE